MGVISDQLARGVLSARELTSALGVSPATLMRRLRSEGERVVRIGKARAIRYGLRQEWPGLHSSEFPLIRIDAAGKPTTAGRLVTLASLQTVWLPAGVVFDGLPPEIGDMQPSGFLGRAFPAQHPDLPLPPRVTDWSTHHILLALSHRGEDAPGNLILGDESFQRWLSAGKPLETSRENYSSLALAALAGQPTGSSAGGDRPKFGTYCRGRHVLVKFAGQGSKIARRWRDLLALEHLALEVLRESGVGAAKSEIIDTPSHRFLEVERFDRIGPQGRRAIMSLAAVHQNLTDTWSAAARRLESAGLISVEDGDRLRLLDAFAGMIANTDRHQYNIALFPILEGQGETMAAEAGRYTLAPSFDQVPMLYAPTDSQLPEREFVSPAPTAETLNVWEKGRALAIAFWRRASEDEAVSRAMRATAAKNADTLSRLA